MKQNKKLWIGIGLICSNYLSAQQAPTNTLPGAATNGTTSNQYWSRAGNSNINGTNNIFGTLWNSPIYFSTNNTNRMKLNGTFTNNVNQPTVNGYSFAQGVNTSGYLLLGNDSPTSLGGTPNLYSTVGAFSLLHLNGPGTFAQTFGYKPWMKTGITLTGNADLSYFGLRTIGGLAPGSLGNDQTETVIA